VRFATNDANIILRDCNTTMEALCIRTHMSS